MRSPEGLARRVATALALLAVFLAALFLLDRRIFGLLATGILGLAAHEWARLSGLGARASLGAAVVFAAALAVLVVWPEPGSSLHAWAFAIGAGFWLLVAPAWLRAGAGTASRGLLLATGGVLLGIAGLAAVSLPPLMLFLVLGLVWIADTAAYFAGHAFGRRRLAPTLSPGKTWEGVAGALGATLAYAIIFGMPGAPLEAYARQAGWPAFLGAALLLCAVSVIGDLFESALKRRAGAKDSGTLLPGHGGVLDRLDSALAALPVAAALVHWSNVA